jgi:hypothetical protein
MRSELRAWRASAWMLGALLVVGCGPGVGGTGTGDAAFAAFGASAAPVCGGNVAATLACPSAPPVGPVSPGGTLPVQFVDPAGQVVLELNGNVALLDASCQHLHFSGEFGTGTNGSQGFFGSYEINGSGPDVLAALSTTPVVGGTALTIELRDVTGQAVVGPVLLQRATGALPTPGPC